MPAPGSSRAIPRPSRCGRRRAQVRIRTISWPAGVSITIARCRGDCQFRWGMSGQVTRDMLVPGEQFGIGGADSVRGFLEREIIDDNGYRGTLELYGPDFGGKVPVSGARMRALAFTDWGVVKRVHPAVLELHGQHVGSVGVRTAFFARHQRQRQAGRGEGYRRWWCAEQGRHARACELGLHLLGARRGQGYAARCLQRARYPEGRNPSPAPAGPLVSPKLRKSVK